MKLFDIINEQEEEDENPTPTQWTKSELGVMKTLHKKGFDNLEPTNIIKFLKTLGFDSDESTDLYYLYKNNVNTDGEFDVTEVPDREKHWEDLEPRQIALGIWLGTDPAVMEDIGNNWGLSTYNTDEGEFSVGTDSESDDAALEAAESNVDYVNPEFAKHYISMSDTDRRLYAQEEADNQVDDMSDEDIIERKDIETEIDDVDIEESENRDKISELESEVDDLESELDDLDEESDSERIKEINDEIQSLNSQIEGLEDIDYDERKEDVISTAREELREEIYDEIYDELDDPIEYFVNTHGFYTIEELIKSGPVFIDEKQMIKDMVDEDGRGHYIASYDSEENYQDYDGETYYIYRVN